MLSTAHIIKRILPLVMLACVTAALAPFIFALVSGRDSLLRLLWIIPPLLAIPTQGLPMLAVKIKSELYGEKFWEEFSTTTFSTSVLKRLKYPALILLALILLIIIMLSFFRSDLLAAILAALFMLVLTQSFSFAEIARVRAMRSDPSDPAHDQPGQLTAWSIMVKLIPTHIFVYAAAFALAAGILGAFLSQMWIYSVLGALMAALLFFLAVCAAQRFVENVTAARSEQLY